ncbi:MAG: MarR family transcriptional regulator [Alphaproteobacteria bacterium]|nr:MarR family transcriptional regulator [Alphaproteobacteria bacterium]
MQAARRPGPTRPREDSVTQPRKPKRAKASQRAPAREPHTPLWTRVGYLIRRVHQNHSALFAEECRAWGITPVQYGVLTALLHRPGSDQATIGLEVGIDRTNAADVLERLAERGLVKRTKSAQDRRMMLATLTREGRVLTADMHDAIMRAQDRLIEALSARERKTFVRMLLRLIDDAAPVPRSNGAAKTRR